MFNSSRRAFAAACALALMALSGFAATGNSQPGGRLTLDRLQRMNECELGALFAASEVGCPLAGAADGRLVHLTDRLPRVKMWLANAVWRGKFAAEDGTFVNRWVGGIRAIGSQYVLGPSWLDGRPAVIMEYPAGTPLFANMHDELREVAPGLYLGPVFERFPTPRLRGFIALQLER